jgi:hypothetical protein
MQKIDVIILTNSASQSDVDMTLRTLLTLKDSEVNYEFRVHLVESGNNHTEKYATTGIISSYIFPFEPFNYNRFINMALEGVHSDWVIISNNDVSYERNWLSEIMAIHAIRPDIQSFSPKDPLLYAKYFPFSFVGTNSSYLEGYRIHEAVMGWCLVIKKESLDLIRPFDEQFDMYYQDNDYAEMLKLHGIKHALARYSIVGHLNTLNILEITEQKRIKMPIDELKFRNKWKLYK